MAKPTKTTTEEKTYWLNDDQVETLVISAQNKGVSLDDAISKLAEAGYSIDGKQVYLTTFVSIWHNVKTNKAVKTFF